MARARNIKPGFFKNENLSDLGLAAQLLFAGLWTLCDRDGKMEWRPRRVKMEIFPFHDDITPDRCTELARCLHDAGFIHIYNVDGTDYLKVVNFTKHQHPNVKEEAAGHPDPEDANWLFKEEKSRGTKPAPSQHRADTVPERPHTPYPIPHTENPIPPSRPAPVDNSDNSAKKAGKGVGVGGFDKSGGGKGEFNIVPLLDDKAWDEARREADGWDIYNLARIYNENINSGQMERPKKPARAFPKWCGRYTKGKHP